MTKSGLRVVSRVRRQNFGDGGRAAGAWTSLAPRYLLLHLGGAGSRVRVRECACAALRCCAVWYF